MCARSCRMPDTVLYADSFTNISMGIGRSAVGHTAFEVMDMERKNAREGVFDLLLRQDAEAASFYAGCTPEQKEAIRTQVHAITTPQEMQAFVSHLSSAAL